MLPSFLHISTCRVSKIYLHVNFITSNNTLNQVHTSIKTVTGYITRQRVHQHCAVKTIMKCANQKPWMTQDICSLLRTWTAAFRPGDTAAYKLVKNNLINCKPTLPGWGKKKAIVSVNPKSQTQADRFLFFPCDSTFIGLIYDHATLLSIHVWKDLNCCHLSWFYCV